MKNGYMESNVLVLKIAQLSKSSPQVLQTNS